MVGAAADSRRAPGPCGHGASSAGVACRRVIDAANGSLGAWLGRRNSFSRNEVDRLAVVAALRSHEVVDPFAVENAWFELLLPSLQLVVTDRMPVALRARAACMLDRLHLGHDERVVRQRREWYRMYQEGELTLDGLTKKAPLIAAAVRKQEAR